MKTVFNIVLALCALVLVYICYASIMARLISRKLKRTERKLSLRV